MKNKISFLLILTFMCLGILPLLGNYFLLEDILLSQQQIYRSNDLNESFKLLDSSLKKLALKDPSHEVEYRAQFQKVQDLKLVYGEDPYFSEALRASVMKYYFILFGLIVCLSFLFGIGISLRVNILYLRLFGELNSEKEKSRFLNEMAKWQEVAQRLAHEIRRPLQPLRIWASQLKKVKPNDESTIREASASIEEEVAFLSGMVNEFSEFASLPKPIMQNAGFGEFIRSFVSQYREIWSETKLELTDNSNGAMVLIDQKLFRPVLTNLIENAIEANPNEKIEIYFKLMIGEKETIVLEIRNTGRSLSEAERIQLFDIHFTTKSNRANRGLGLPIVKTIILEHGGDIDCLEVNSGVCFRIAMPRHFGGQK